MNKATGMISLSILIMAVLAFSALAKPVEVAKFCTDSDNGKNIWAAGIATDEKGANADDCDGASGNLKEFYCDGNTTKLDNIKCSDYNATCVTVGNSSVADYCSCPTGYEFSVDKCVLLPYCGDGVKNNAEECDGTDGVGNHQACNNDCLLETLPYCGDNIINGAETCDSDLGVSCTPACGSTCDYCDQSCGLQTNIGGSCGDYCTINPTAPGCGTHGVPEFTPMTFAAAITIAGLGLAYFRKQ